MATDLNTVPALCGTLAAPITIRVGEPGAAWDEYVLRHEHGTPFHLLAWKRCIETTFSYKPQYLWAMEGSGTIRGVLPLFLIDNIIIGKALISTPFAVYGGILADDESVGEALLGKAKELGYKLGVAHIDLRNSHDSQCIEASNVSRYCTFTKSVIANEQELLELLPKKTRNIVRKTLKTPFQVRIHRCVHAFERLHSENMRRLGTPCFPRRHFESLVEHFGDRVDIRDVLLEGKVVATSLNFLFRGVMHTYYAASDPAYNGVAPNTFMYFDHLRWCGSNGYTTFEFGRSKKGTGPFEFKRHWGTEMRELPYNIVLIGRKEVPNFSPSNENFRLAIDTWKRLPLPLTRVLGPYFIRLFP